MNDDDEIKAMTHVAAALTPLDDGARNRVLQWAVSRFRGKNQAFASGLSDVSAMKGGQSDGLLQFESFAELFEATHPSTEREKGLVAAYWVQIGQSQPSFGSQTLNDALKDLGHGVKYHRCAERAEGGAACSPSSTKEEWHVEAGTQNIQTNPRRHTSGTSHDFCRRDGCRVRKIWNRPSPSWQ